MLQVEVLICEFVAVDRFSTSAIVIGEITTLAHEIWNHAMECWAFVAKTFLTGAEGTEVFASTRYLITTELCENNKDKLIAVLKSMMLKKFSSTYHPKKNGKQHLLTSASFMCWKFGPIMRD